VRSLYKLLFVVIIVAIGAVIARGLIMTKPVAKRKPVSITAPLVEYIEVNPQSHRVMVYATGTVIPARQVSVQPQVKGAVIWTSPGLVPGTLVKADEELVRIDPRDYELAVVQHRASLAKAQVDFEIEQGRYEVAGREWELLQGDVQYTQAGRDLALRKPQLENAKAGIDAAKSVLKKAELDLERTVIYAPFNAVIISESVDAGQLVSSGVAIATLAGSDTFRVQASLKIDDLAWIYVPGANAEKGSHARVIQQSGADRENHTGVVERLLSDVDAKGRMARVLISIPDPFEGNRQMPLLLGAYVAVEIEGKSLKDVYVIPDKAFRQGGKVWLIKADNTLFIKEIEFIRRQKNNVIVKGLSPRDRLITSRISAPVDGMKLRTDSNDITRHDEEK